jgi:hypothetical protein
MNEPPAFHGARSEDLDMSAGKPSPVRRKLLAFDEATWQALDVLARDSMKSWQELSDEAFSDLLKKHGRTDDLKTALKLSIKQAAPEGKRQRGKRGK